MGEETLECIEENKKIKKIGIIGGTFDPIHYGHLIAAHWAQECFSLDKVIFMPAGTPPHKLDNNVLSAEHRYNMTLLATNDQPNFEVSSMEIKRKGPSYTIDTINELHRLYKGKDTQILFITGADSILEIHTWKRYEDLLRKCFFIAVTREGYDTLKLNRRIEDIHKIFGKRIFNVEIPSVGISSTELRKRIGNNKSVKYLVPSMVEQYIIKNQLYK